MIKVHTFKSGLRLAYQHADSHVSHCGLMIGAGSRHESKGKEGLAHFIEHVLFKGTKKRTATQVLTRLEAVGGELNAYTTREETCVHASFMPRHFERAADLITDIVLHSSFPDKEIAKEKEVVLDEILSYMDNPMEQIFDDFECQVFKGHPLGNPVLGSSESVRNFKRSDLITFVNKHYLPSSMVFSYIGPHTFQEVCDVVENCFDVRKSSRKSPARTSGKIRKPLQKVENLPVKQAHWIGGGSSCSFRDPKRFSMYLMNNILGGPGMNSRLNMNIRERYGFTYNIESSYTPYRDTGLFAVYLATEQKHLNRTIELVQREFKKLREVRIGTAQLAMHKTQIKGQIAIAQENRASVMLGNAKSVLNYGYPVTVEEVFRKIDEVTSSAILETANKTLAPSVTGTLVYVPS